MVAHVKNKQLQTKKSFAPSQESSEKKMESETNSSSSSLMAPASGYQHRFDFEIGYLVQSPCKGCDHQGQLPLCADNCETLDNIHSILSKSVSCTKGA